MNICVFGAARDELDPGYFTLAEALGETLGRRGHTMIFGGGAHGLMGAAARGCARSGAPIIGVAPRFFHNPGVLFDDCTELIFTDTMAERKTIMFERADAFLALPGGLGTFDEIFEALTLRALNRHGKGVAFLEYDGYWQPAKDLIDRAIEQGFAAPGVRDLCGLFTDPEVCVAYLEGSAK